MMFAKKGIMTSHFTSMYMEEGMGT